MSKKPKPDVMLKLMKKDCIALEKALDFFLDRCIGEDATQEEFDSIEKINKLLHDFNSKR